LTVVWDLWRRALDHIWLNWQRQPRQTAIGICQSSQQPQKEREDRVRGRGKTGLDREGHIGRAKALKTCLSNATLILVCLTSKYSERLWGTGDWGSVRGRGRGTRDLCILGHSACGLNHAQWAAAQIKNTFQKRKNRETHRQRATTRK